MRNMTLNSNEDISNRIRSGKPQIRSFEVKAASPQKQRCFNMLNKMQGNPYYPLALKIVQYRLKNN